MNQTLRRKLILLSAVAGVAVGTAAADALAQARNRAAGRDGQAQRQTTRGDRKAPAPAAAESGLGGVGDDALLSELSARGLESLLTRAFEANNVPQAQRKGFIALRGLGQLTDKSRPLSAGQRAQVVSQVVAGIKTVLPELEDPDKLMEYAGILITEGAARDVNVMEYWGETPAAQARLRPVVEAVNALYEKAAANYLKAREELERTRMKGNSVSDRVAKEWEELERREGDARYTQAMADYMRAIATPPEDEDKRKKIAADAITFLSDHDNEDSGVQPTVRLRIGQLHMAAGDFAKAKEVLATVIAGQTKPAPNAFQVNEARTFSVLSDLQSGDLQAARKGLAEMEQWQQANLPKDEDTQKRVAAADDMIRYRITQAEAELAQGPAKKTAEDAALAILMKLSKDPNLQPIIFEQLVERVVQNRPVKGMEPLLLQAVLQKALSEVQKGPDAKLDDKAMANLAKGVEAAREMVSRKGQPGIEDNRVEWAALMIPTFLQRAGKKVEAAAAYIDFIQQFPQSQERQGAFNEAGRLIIVDLRQDPAKKGDAAVAAVYERFLPIAINPPYNRKDLAWDYAQRLREAKKYDEAVKYYAMVPPNDPKRLAADYLRMIALVGLLDQQGPDKKPVLQGPARQQTAAQVLQLSETIRKAALAKAAAAKDEKTRIFEQTRAAGSVLTAAEIAAEEQKDPKRVLEVLATFEKDFQKVPNFKDMRKEALFRRVSAYMANGQYDQATKTLTTLLAGGGQEGQGMVLGLLQRLEEDYKKARAGNDDAAMMQIAKNRAALSGFLVKWAAESQAPDIKKYEYNYRVYDAENKLLAGMKTNDKKLLEEALKAFQRLMEPDMQAMYKAQFADDKKALANFEKFPYHPNVLLGLGRAQFLLGDYKGADKNLGLLIANRKLGSDRIEKVDAKTNDVTYEDNEPYWAAWYMLLKSKQEIFNANRGDAAAKKDLEEAKRGLKQLYIINREPGGEEWKEEFASLRKGMIPDFNPAALPVTTQPSQPDRPVQPAAKPQGEPVAAGARR